MYEDVAVCTNNSLLRGDILVYENILYGRLNIITVLPYPSRRLQDKNGDQKFTILCQVLGLLTVVRACFFLVLP